jgi:hypothetical protein
MPRIAAIAAVLVSLMSLTAGNPAKADVLADLGGKTCKGFATLTIDKKGAVIISVPGHDPYTALRRPDYEGMPMFASPYGGILGLASLEGGTTLVVKTFFARGSPNGREEKLSCGQAE